MSRLKELRKQNHLTQAQVGKELSITSQAYGNYENGNRSIPYEQIKKLAAFYKVTTDYLMGATDDPTRQLPIEHQYITEPPIITDDFHVSVTGPICDEAWLEIQKFVAQIKQKYGYPKQYRGIKGAIERQKELSHNSHQEPPHK